MLKICGFFSTRYFYGGLLNNGPQDRTSFLRPYTLFNLRSRERQEGGQIWNDDEARFVCKLVRTVEEERRKNQCGQKEMGISVITFYSK